MDLQSTLLSALSEYGLIAVFVSVLISSFGLPLPTSFLLLVVGGFVASGDLDFVSVMLAATLGSIVGDHLGYGLGRLGGERVLDKLARLLKAGSAIQKAQDSMQKWGGFSVFLSRWLITAIGPYINFISGITNYRLFKFSFWDVVGETLWVGAYVGLGMVFSDRIAEVSDALGDLVWVIAAGVVFIVLLRKLIMSFRKPGARNA
ncbi:MAG: VTT domain-containing protein [Anaerolineae bacterium]|nr:VTT domain-containing protein [Anaerolineae bacterium]